MSNYNPYTKRQTMIAPDYEVYRYRSTYMNEVELHHHDFYEVYLLLRGRVEYIVENQLYRVRPGDWMLCSPLELHQARIATDADAYERIVLWIARPYLEGLSTAHTSATKAPVMDAVRVPPSASSTSQSRVMVLSPSWVISTAWRRARPISR